MSKTDKTQTQGADTQPQGTDTQPQGTDTQVQTLTITPNLTAEALASALATLDVAALKLIDDAGDVLRSTLAAKVREAAQKLLPHFSSPLFTVTNSPKANLIGFLREGAYAPTYYPIGVDGPGKEPAAMKDAGTGAEIQGRLLMAQDCLAVIKTGDTFTVLRGALVRQARELMALAPSPSLLDPDAQTSHARAARIVALADWLDARQAVIVRPLPATASEAAPEVDPQDQAS